MRRHTGVSGWQRRSLPPDADRSVTYT